jgi:hypothetical protein
MDTLLRLWENVRRKGPEEWDLGVSDFFPDVVSVHSAISLLEFLSKSEMIVVPPTPSHTTCNIWRLMTFIFQKLEVALKGGRFNGASTIQARSGDSLAEIPTMQFVKFCER